MGSSFRRLGQEVALHTLGWLEAAQRSIFSVLVDSSYFDSARVQTTLANSSVSPLLGKYHFVWLILLTIGSRLFTNANSSSYALTVMWRGDQTNRRRFHIC